VGFFFRVYALLISQTLIGKFVMESGPLTVQGLVLLLAKWVGNCLCLSVFCLKIGQNLKGVVEERGMISKREAVRIYYLCVMC